MRDLFNKVITVYLGVLLIPAVTCLCCEFSHAESGNNCCCHDESDNHTDSSSTESCCKDCLFQTLHREELALLGESEKKSDESLTSPEGTPEPNHILLNSDKSTYHQVNSSISHGTISIPSINPVKSSPYQGRSPPLTVA